MTRDRQHCLFGAAALPSCEPAMTVGRLVARPLTTPLVNSLHFGQPLGSIEQAQDHIPLVGLLHG